MKNSFKSVAATEENPKWGNIIKRENSICQRENDIRSEFARDYTRILHSNAYRRLKHKTQVFYSPSSDHVCTRSEHVQYVDSISNTIAKYLGLNTELTRAIAIAHDIGHSPFGHKGERILSEISQRDLGITFWHEKNGVHFVDDIALLENTKGELENLNLTYAVRDGIISHCGEIDENSIKPRAEAINLAEYMCPNQFNPYTWEACVVKISDKISYIGRDLEDAVHLKLLDQNDKIELKEILELECTETLNNTNIIFDLITDLCENSSPEKGLCFSTEKLNLINKLKAFNYKKIYTHPRLDASNEFFGVVINKIYDVLKSAYCDGDSGNKISNVGTINEHVDNTDMSNVNNNNKEDFDGVRYDIERHEYGNQKNCNLNNKTLKKLEELELFYPQLIESFKEWLFKYWVVTDRSGTNLKNRIVYDNTKQGYLSAIIDFIAGMTDNFAINSYKEIISF